MMGTVGAWRSLVAHLHGVQGVGSSNLLAPTNYLRVMRFQLRYTLGYTFALRLFSGSRQIRPTYHQPSPVDPFQTVTSVSFLALKPRRSS